MQMVFEHYTRTPVLCRGIGMVSSQNYKQDVVFSSRLGVVASPTRLSFFGKGGHSDYAGGTTSYYS